MGNREHCKGCIHYRELATGGAYQVLACHLAIDTDILRDCPVDDCPFYHKGNKWLGDHYRENGHKKGEGSNDMLDRIMFTTIGGKENGYGNRKRNRYRRSVGTTR